MKNTIKLGVTGPSIFSDEIQGMCEGYLNSCPIYIINNKEDHLDYLVKQIDGLVLAGGVDWCPLSRGQEITRGEGFSKFDYARDLREMYLIQKCLEFDKPILGICRGMQGLGLYHKMYLVNDISGSDVIHSPKSAGIDIDGLNGLGCHKLNILDEFQDEFGFKDYYCSSFHHQALWFNKSNDYTKKGVEVLGTACLDYETKTARSTHIIELMRGINNRWIAAQNHLETEWRQSKEARIILDKFKEMFE